MKKWKLKNGIDIFLISAGKSNVYLISTPTGNILVDTGWKFSFNGLRRNINSLRLTQPITHLILTHTHFDHCYNAFILCRQENCLIIAGAPEEKYCLAGYTPIPAGTLIGTRLLAGLGTLIGGRWFGYPPFKTDLQIGEVPIFPIDGYPLEVISTPGHSSGSLSVIINNELAIVGDTMLGIARNSIFPPFADDIGTLLNSWQILLNSRCNLFLPGHGRAINRELLQREYVKYSKKYAPLLTR